MGKNMGSAKLPSVLVPGKIVANPQADGRAAAVILP